MILSIDVKFFNLFFFFSSVNYENENLNIGLPVFTIHGNHDDPSGEGNLSAVDVLSSCGLVNYFGKSVRCSMDSLLCPKCLQGLDLVYRNQKDSLILTYYVTSCIQLWCQPDSINNLSMRQSCSSKSAAGLLLLAL